MPKSLLTMLSLAMLFSSLDSANALAPFKKAFDEKYVKPSENAEFQAAFKKGSCNVCHVKGKKKDWLNAYGLALAENIPGAAKERLDKAKAEGSEASKAENELLLKELKVAFKKSEAVKSPSGDLFGAMFKEHKLPTEKGAKSIYAPDPKEADEEKK